MIRKIVWKCRLKEIRKESGLTLRDLEESIGVDDVTILFAEKGCGISLDTAMRIAKFFCLPIESIWIEFLGER